MIAIEDHAIQRVVVPRWLRYQDAIVSKELFTPGDAVPFLDPELSTELVHFRKSPSPLLASDLLGRALLTGRQAAVRELGEYIISNSHSAALTKTVARRLLSKQEEHSVEENIQKQIHATREALREYPRDALSWIDLARLYTIVNNRTHAVRAIRIAVAVAPSDRFCLRAAARCFLHFGDIESAHELFASNISALKDPWILATAASVASLAERPSPLPRKPISTSLEHPFHYSEFLEAYAMEEYASGKDRLSRKIFRQAWTCPSVNVITHAEWLTRTHLPGLRNATEIQSGRSVAALTHARFAVGDIDGALEAVEAWQLEEPYSAQPLIHGTFLACLKEDFKRVMRYYHDACQRNLLHPFLLNNVAFAMIHLGDLVEAEMLLQRLRAIYGTRIGYTLSATEGLLELKLGRVENGIRLYEEARAAAEPPAKDKVLLSRYLSLLRCGFPISDKDKETVAEIRRKGPDPYEELLLAKLSAAQANVLSAEQFISISALSD